MSRIHRALLLLAVTAICGCAGTNLERYGRSRALDFADSLPVSVAGGLGLLVQARVTSLAGIGLGYANTTRYGFDDQRFGPVWSEKERGVPVLSYYRVQHYEGREKRWSGGDPKWWSESYRARASSLIVLPGFPREGDVLVPIPGPLDAPAVDLWNFEPWIPFFNAYHHRAPWHWPGFSWVNLTNVEVGIVLGPVGLRLGVSPIQLVDFIGGIFLYDFALDDIRSYPVLWPDPDATPSFPAEPSATPAGRDSDAPSVGD
jgi:hypothetical protein